MLGGEPALLVRGHCGVAVATICVVGGGWTAESGDDMGEDMSGLVAGCAEDKGCAATEAGNVIPGG